MKYEVEHEIRWRYDQPVFVEPMTVRLRPRCDGSLLLARWRISIDPQPAGMCDSLDALGNAVTLVWFGQHHDRLLVSVVSAVETTRANPFDYLLTGPEANDLPLGYGGVLPEQLAPYLRRLAADQQIDHWAGDLAASSGDAQAFLVTLTERLFTDYERTTRADGPAYSPAETFQARSGACRDLAVLFVDACRSVGIAARFVSGYAYEPDREGENELHAWAEVYLPGAGWRGYDPSMGLAAADRHIPLAAAPEPKGAAPTAGTFRGTDTKSTIDFKIRIRAQGDG